MTLPRRLLVALPAALAACSPTDLINATVSSRGVTVQQAAYAPGPSGGLTVYRPDSPAGPLVVFLYGGAWRTGRRDDFAFVARPLAARGITVVIPDYRLFPEVRFPTFLEDNAAATAWALANAAALGADPSRVFLMGHSAGAYNAAMLALDPRWMAGAGTARDRLAGVIGLAGPYDFLPMLGAEREVFAPDPGPLTQPINYVDGRNPPLTLLAGDADDIVQPRNTLSLATKVRQAGGPVQAKIYPGLGHIGIITAMTPLFAGRAPVLDDVTAALTAPSSPEKGSG